MSRDGIFVETDASRLPDQADAYLDLLLPVAGTTHHQRVPARRVRQTENGAGLMFTSTGVDAIHALRDSDMHTTGPGADTRARNLCSPSARYDSGRPPIDSAHFLAPPARVAKHPRTLKKGEFLFRVGDPFRAIFSIQSGSVKTSILSHGGGVQVLSFALPGELLGVNAIATARHPSDAVALEATQLCELSFAQLETLARSHPDVQHRLLRLLSDEIARDEKLMAMLGHQKADVRLADCLLDLHQRCQRPGQTGTPFRLPMSRQDIADYLGLSLETVSRLLSRFQKAGLLHVQGRQVRLLDMARLRSIGNPGAVAPPRTA